MDDEHGSAPELADALTPEILYLNRRKFLKALGLAGASALVLAACGGQLPGIGGATPTPGGPTDETGAPWTPYDSIVTYNNFYEFSTDLGAVAALSQHFTTTPWQVEVGGLVQNP